MIAAGQGYVNINNLLDVDLQKQPLRHVLITDARNGSLLVLCVVPEKDSFAVTSEIYCILHHAY